MEQQTIEGASTSDAVGFITVVQSLKRKLKNWEKNVEVWNCVSLQYMLTILIYIKLLHSRNKNAMIFLHLNESFTVSLIELQPRCCYPHESF